MLFAATKILWLILRPSVLAVLLALLGYLRMSGERRGRRGKLLLGLGLGYYLAVLVLPLHVWIARPLEDRFPRQPYPDHVDGIVVLGGAVDEELSEDSGLPALNENAERMTEAVSLARRYPEAPIVFSGGSGRLFGSGIPEAEAATRFFARLGVPATQIRTENASRDTGENAEFTRDLVKPQAGQTWLLVTSALHMPRAFGIFRHAGWTMLPWPVGYKTGHKAATYYHDSFPQRLQVLDAALHEWVGLAVYRLRGRTDALFPAPITASVE